MTKENNNIQLTEVEWFKLFYGMEHHRVNINLVIALGDRPALLLTEIMGRWYYFKKQNMIDELGYFYCTREEIENRTMMSTAKQMHSMKRLKKLRLVRTKLKGVPPKLHYKIEVNRIAFVMRLVDELKEKSKNLNFKETYKLILKKMQNQFVRNSKNINNNKNENKEGSKEPMDDFSNHGGNSSLAKSIKPFLDYWYKKEFTVKHNKQTKTYKKAKELLLQLINGTLFEYVPDHEQYLDRKFTLEEWKKSVDNYGLAFDKFFSPLDKSKLARPALDAFLFNPKATDGTYSRFIKYLTYKPKRMTKTTTDKFPSTSVALCRHLQLREPTIKVMEASENIENFFKKHKHKLDSSINGSSKKKVDLCFKVADIVTNDTVSPSLFVQDWFYERMHKWLVDNGYLLTRRRR